MRKLFLFLRRRWDYSVVISLSCLASWWYFFGTPFILGLDYFTHLAQGYVLKTGILHGDFIPAWNPFYGSGKVFIRYQAMLVVQFMGWLCLALERCFSLSGPQAIIYVGRITCVVINLLAGLSCHYALKKWLPTPACLAGVTAYLFGWQRLGVLLHVGALQRAGAFAFYPVCFSLTLLSFRRSLSRKEQAILGISLAGCLLAHPGSFILLMVLLGLQGLVETICKIVNLRNFKESMRQCRRWMVNLLLPASIFLGLTAWYTLPASLEKDYYGYYRSNKLKMRETPAKPTLAKTLPLKYAKELVDRTPWFKNHMADPKLGGSYLGNIDGVNSGYCGYFVLLAWLLSLFLFLYDRQLGKTVYRLSATASILLIMIFWPGLRDSAFSILAIQISLPHRWLEAFYFLLSIIAAFGALTLWRFCESNFRKEKIWGFAAIVMLCLLIAGDFLSLIYQKRMYPASYKGRKTCYIPQHGKISPLGLDWNWAVLDSYDKLINRPKDGKVLDIPPLLFNCNRVYHGHKQARSLEVSVDWMEASSYDRLVFGEVRPAIGRGLPEYMNYHPLYSLSEVNFEFDPACVSCSPGLEIKTIPEWGGETTMKINYRYEGNSKVLLLLPFYLPANSEVLIESHGKRTIRIEAGSHGRAPVIKIPRQGVEPELCLTLKLIDRSYREPIAVGFRSAPVILYSGPGLAYRLAIGNTRFIVLNLEYLGNRELLSSPWIEKIYQSSTSALYENTLSRPCFLPEKTYLITGPRPWKFFNENIAHYPLYNPCLAGFCYRGAPESYDGVIRSDDKQWRRKIAQIFDNGKSTANSAQKIEETMESVTYRVNMEREGFFFPCIRYHPNLKAILLRGDRLPTVLAQAGMIAVKLPAGKHILKIYYCHPWYDRAGKLVSAIASFLSLGACIYLLFFKKTAIV